MKYLLVLAVVAAAIWIWRGQRAAEAARSTPPVRRTPQAPTPMVACRHCGTHLPEAECVRGQRGLYCSAEHLRLGEPGR